MQIHIIQYKGTITLKIYQSDSIVINITFEEYL